MSSQLPSGSSRIFTFMGLALCALLLSLACFWQLWEQDIFWQIRSGEEFLATGTLPMTDSWSFSAAGQPWMNLQWLATVILSGIYSAGGVPGLIIARMFGAFLCLGISGLIILKTVKSPHRSLIVLGLLPLVLFALNFRLQIRSELFVFIWFALLVLIQSLDLAPVKKYGAGIGLIILSSNLHPGVSVFLVFAFSLDLFCSELSLSGKLKVLSLAVLGYFLTPYHFKILAVLFDHLNYYGVTVIDNPDHEAFAWRHFDSERAGWVGVSFVTLSLLSLFGIYQKFHDNKKKLFLTLLGFGVLFVMSVLRMRAIPFFIILFLPFSATALSSAVLGLNSKKRVLTASVYGGVLWGVMFPYLFFHPLYAFGWGYNRQILAVGSVTFIHREKALPQIYHQPAEGDLLLGFAPEYKVFIDPREMMYKNVHREMAAAWNSAAPTRTHQLLEKYAINTILLPSHRILQNADGSFVDKVEILFPHDQWALVYFDLRTMVLVRRRAEHEKIIQGFEFKLLKPHLPPEYFLFKAPEFTQALSDEYKTEFERCLHNEPDQPHCLAAKGFWLLKTEAKDQYGAVINQLEKSFEQYPENLPVGNILLQFYKKLGDQKSFERVEDAFKSQTL